MKKLLLILFAFTASHSLWGYKNNFICDTSHFFSPELEERIMLKINTDNTYVKGYGFFTNFSGSVYVSTMLSGIDVETKSISMDLGAIGTITIDRMTGEYQFDENLRYFASYSADMQKNVKLDRDCELISDDEFEKEKIKTESFISSLIEKRKF